MPKTLGKGRRGTKKTGKSKAKRMPRKTGMLGNESAAQMEALGYGAAMRPHPHSPPKKRKATRTASAPKKKPSKPKSAVFYWPK